MKKSSGMVCGLSILALSSVVLTAGLAQADNSTLAAADNNKKTTAGENTAATDAVAAKKSHARKSAKSNKRKAKVAADNAAPPASPSLSKDEIKSSSAAPSAPGAGNVSTTTEKTAYEKFTDKFSAVYFGIYRGAQLNDLGNTYQPDTNGNLDRTSPQSIESYITPGYRITPDTTIGVSTHFFYFPTQTADYGGSMMKPAQTGVSGMDVQMLDPALMISQKNMIDSNGWKLKGMLYVTLPMTHNDYLYNHSESLIVAPTYNLTWDIPKTKWTLGLYGYLADYVPNSSTPGTARQYKFYAAPYANYQFAPTVAATMWIDLIQATRIYNNPIIGGISNPTMDIEPGINWDITPHFAVNPMINIYPSNMSIAATSLQAVIIGHL